MHTFEVSSRRPENAFRVAEDETYTINAKTISAASIRRPANAK